MAKTRWGVVSTVSEPLPLIIAFVAHYLELGASRIHLYFDKPFDEIKAILNDTPQVITHRKPNKFYGSGDDEPLPHILHRQRMNANHSYAYTDVDWLLHVDADEFLECSDFSDLLSQQADNVASVRILNQERAYVMGQPIESIFDGVAIHHHKWAKRWVRKALDREFGPYYVNGFLGHSSGKSAVRTGLEARMGIHSPRSIPDMEVANAKGLLLHHFDGLTPAHWTSKLLRFIRTNRFMKGGDKSWAMNRHNLLMYVLDSGASTEKVFELHDDLRVLSEGNIALRERFDLVSPIGINPVAAVEKWFPDQNIDLSVEAFDNVLAERDPDYATWLAEARAAA